VPPNGISVHMCSSFDRTVHGLHCLRLGSRWQFTSEATICAAAGSRYVSSLTCQSMASRDIDAHALNGPRPTSVRSRRAVRCRSSVRQQFLDPDVALLTF
jgi:hypothetical protein